MNMKKIVFLFSLCLCVGFPVMAQDVDEEGIDAAYFSKRGVYLLPQAGDFALGIDATPFLGYLGNFFSRSNHAPDFNGLDQMIYGKYFLEDDRALRLRLGLSVFNSANKGVVPNDFELANNPLNANASVVDIHKRSSTEVTLGLGYEIRRGKGRVQGYYGGEVLLGFESGKNLYEYANPFTNVNQVPSSYDFNGNTWWSHSYSRATEEKYGNRFSAGLLGLVGVEYFFAPQMSIGGELGLGFLYSIQGQSERTFESWNSSADKVQIQSDRWDDWNAQSAGAYTHSYGGRIFLMFHF
jgi:hypothetical protein